MKCAICDQRVQSTVYGVPLCRGHRSKMSLHRIDREEVFLEWLRGQQRLQEHRGE